MHHEQSKKRPFDQTKQDQDEQKFPKLGHGDVHAPKQNNNASKAQMRFTPGPFDYQRLDAYRVALQALHLGDNLARKLPRGYAKLADQLRRALLSSYLLVAEAASRKGDDRASRFRIAKGEASEAADALEAVTVLGLASKDSTQEIITLCARLYAMLSRLERVRR